MFVNFMSVNFTSAKFVPGHFDGPPFSCPLFSAHPNINRQQQGAVVKRHLATIESWARKIYLTL